MKNAIRAPKAHLKHSNKSSSAIRSVGALIVDNYKSLTGGQSYPSAEWQTRALSKTLCQTQRLRG